MKNLRLLIRHIKYVIFTHIQQFTKIKKKNTATYNTKLAYHFKLTFVKMILCCFYSSKSFVPTRTGVGRKVKIVKMGKKNAS